MMQLADYYPLFLAGMITGMVIMVVAHLIGVIIRMFFKIAR